MYTYFGLNARGPVKCVQLGLKTSDDEMVVDGGGHFGPAGIYGVHILSLLLSSHTAHDRAEVNPHTHTNYNNTERGYSTSLDRGV